MAEQQQVNPQEARTFLTGFGHNADALKGMGDEDVVKLHGTVSGKVGEITSKAQKPFADNWREHLAGEDPEAMKTLGRFTDPTQLWKRTQELTKKLSSGELRAVTAFPDKGTDEEKGAWRKANDVPEKPEAYDVKLSNGLVIGEADKPVVDKFLKYAHDKNIPQSVVKSNLEWLFGDFKVEQERATAEAQAVRKRETEDALREVWGGDYRTNTTAIENMIARHVKADSDLKDRIIAGAQQDPEFALLLGNLALEIDPQTGLVPNTGQDKIKTVETELRRIHGLMTTDRKAYNREAPRYQELLAAYEKLSGKAWDSK